MLNVLNWGYTNNFSLFVRWIRRLKFSSLNTNINRTRVKYISIHGTDQSYVNRSPTITLLAKSERIKSNFCLEELHWVNFLWQKWKRFSAMLTNKDNRCQFYSQRKTLIRIHHQNRQKRMSRSLSLHSMKDIFSF